MYVEITTKEIKKYSTDAEQNLFTLELRATGVNNDIQEFKKFLEENIKDFIL